MAFLAQTNIEVDETDLNAKRDYFGGVAAKQHIVYSLRWG
jgi:hypothetical protein